MFKDIFSVKYPTFIIFIGWYNLLKIMDLLVYIIIYCFYCLWCETVYRVYTFSKTKKPKSSIFLQKKNQEMFAKILVGYDDFANVDIKMYRHRQNIQISFHTFHVRCLTCWNCSSFPQIACLKLWIKYTNVQRCHIASP